MANTNLYVVINVSKQNVMANSQFEIAVVSVNYSNLHYRFGQPEGSRSLRLPDFKTIGT